MPLTIRIELGGHMCVRILRRQASIGRLCAHILCDSIFQSFMRRVRAEITCRNLSSGSREKPVLLLLCATSRDLPVKHNRLENTVVQRKSAQTTVGTVTQRKERTIDLQKSEFLNIV